MGLLNGWKGNSMKNSLLIYALAAALAPQVCFSQQLALNSPVDVADSATAAPSSSVTTRATTAPVLTTADHKPLLDRWLDLKTFSHSERYRNAFAVGGVHVFDNAQQRSLIEGKIKLDAEGRYAIGFRASSGRYFNWS